MRFVPKTPREGINVSDVHPLAEAGTLILGLSLMFAAAAVALVFLVEIVLSFVSTDQETRLFSGWLPNDLVSVSAEDDRLNDTRLLLGRLAGHWPDAPYAFRVEIGESERPNAMAFPGGLVIVTTGLLDSVETENELAFVLGHELGHFRNRDHIRLLGRSVAFSIFFSALTGNESSGGLGITIADLTLRGFSREQESNADRFGLQVIQAEYGHIGESWRFFERAIEADDAPAFTAYLSTHPMAADRIDDLRMYARSRGWPLSGPTRDVAWRN